MSKQTSGFKPTPAQEAAIQAAGGSITVSAAAGSGKTRVLVQRVIRLLTGDDPVPADRLLILTFTNTAAAEMKTRISKAIDELIEKHPRDDFYRRQQLLLGSADICTIDSFCSKTVRENFFRLGISRDFRIGGIPELYEMQVRVMSDIIEERYKRPSAEGKTEEQYQKELESYHSFSLLSLLLTNTKLDTGLEAELLDIYTKYTAHAFPEEWMEGCVEMYSPESSINESKSAVYLFSSIRDNIGILEEIYAQAASYREYLEEQNRQSKGKKKIYVNTLSALDAYRNTLEGAKALFDAEQLDISAVAELFTQFQKIKISPGGSKDEDAKTAIKLLNLFADTVTEKCRHYTCYTDELYRRNNRQLYPVMQELKSVMEEFDRRFFEAKCEKGMLDFRDLEALMLKLLYESDGRGGHRLTDFAKEMSKKYVEIMGDEYQDTNDIQESIFKAVSRNEENLFVVGDIKQSIYRFREAKPDLFKSRCDNAELYSKAERHFPALIVLDRNFRSRKGLIDSVNYVFGLLMSEESGDIEYDELHKLDAGASYPERSGADTELHLIEYKKNSSVPDEEDSEEEDADRTQTEAAYCAALIRKMMDEGFTVKDEASDGGLRKAKFSDFCILMRAVQNKAHIYAAELEKLKIPSYMDTDFNLLECYEVKAAVSYLKALNNPLSDVDMIASLMCPVFGFTPDELVKIKRLKGRCYYKKLLNIVCSDKEQDDKELQKKCSSFIEIMKELRTLSVTVPTDKLLTEFFERTGFISVMCAMPNGEGRIQNLRRLVSFAAGYESSTAGGLTGLVRHIKSLEETKSGIKVSDSASVNAVKIMTIHHSKGLEFPICILAGTNSVNKNSMKNINYHSVFGMGLRAMYDERLLKFDTLQYRAVEQAILSEEKSEQLRVLYVAMTRPKEKLIILSTINCSADERKKGEDTDDKQDGLTAFRKYLYNLARKTEYIPTSGRIAAGAVRDCKTFSDMMIMCSLLNGSMKELRHDACVVGSAEDDRTDMPEEAVCLPALDSGTPWKYVHVQSVEKQAQSKINESKSAEGNDDRQQTDPALEAFLKERFEKKPADITTLIPSKVSASMLAHKGVSSMYVASSKPSFARSGRISPTERGTATHAFLQYADLRLLREGLTGRGDFEQEKQRLVNEKIMSAEQAELIIPESIKAFAESRLFERMLRAVNLYREYRFTVNIPGELALANDPAFKQIRSETHGQCETILQGAVDCIVEEDDGILIVDYKTDRVKEPSELAEIYGLQLRLYKMAAEMLFDKPVKECCIYSLYTGCEVPVKV